MSYCDKSAVNSYEKWSSLAQFAAGQIGKRIAGPGGAAFGTFLTGKNTWVARTADALICWFIENRILTTKI
ncbi:hypothetical protein [Kingella potus]|uniref:hypothetical protein n=1 Tax=Kingella potus TaxID=265175 RepID=UPI0011C07066|nr:hypothetical protein [Kingella potus]UOP01421.1 hypothetical protein LVJ84_04200 [Kingella potus]